MWILHNNFYTPLPPALSQKERCLKTGETTHGQTTSFSQGQNVCQFCTICCTETENRKKKIKRNNLLIFHGLITSLWKHSRSWDHQNERLQDISLQGNPKDFCRTVKVWVGQHYLKKPFSETLQFSYRVSHCCLWKYENINLKASNRWTTRKSSRSLFGSTQASKFFYLFKLRDTMMFILVWKLLRPQSQTWENRIKIITAGEHSSAYQNALQASDSAPKPVSYASCDHKGI